LNWNVNGPVEVQWLPISESLFTDIWSAGILQSLNAVCSLCIDEYGEEVLPPEQLNLALAVVDSLRSEIKESEPAMFLDQLIAIFRTAISTNRPIYFVL
jgi:hypothetical protein